MAGITLSGFNGIDFNTILEAVLQYERLPLQALQAEQQKIQNKDSAFVSLAGLVSALRTPVTSLTNADAFSRVAVSSGDTSVATVASGAEAIIGHYNVSIAQLAKSQVTKTTSGFSATTDIAATGGSISFTIDGTTTTAISIASDTTLAALAEQINDQNSGVMASVINDGTNYKLVISGRETGASNGFTINNSLTNSAGTAVAFEAGQSSTAGNAQNAQNAILVINGIDIQSASNTVNEAIPGVALTILKPGDVVVNATRNYSTLKDDLKAIVSQYNKLREFYTQQAKGPLGGDPVLREVLKDIRTVLLKPHSNGGRYQYLSEVGLELTSSGDLKLDESKLDTAIASYSSDLAKLFQGATGAEGIFDTLVTTLNSLDGSAGLIKTTRESIRNTLARVDDRIEQQEHMLEIRRQALMKMFTAADEAIARLNQMTAAISNLNRGF